MIRLLQTLAAKCHAASERIELVYSWVARGFYRWARREIRRTHPDAPMVTITCAYYERRFAELWSAL